MIFKEILKLLSRDNLQVQALTECYEMLDLCHRMVHASIQSLRHADDAAIDIDIVEMDRSLNKFERDVRRKVMTHLSLGNNPDISSGLVLVSVVIDIERIGDYSKNIYGLARQHPKRLHVSTLEDQLKAIEKAALDNFDRSVAAFKSGDLEEARRLMTDYKDDISKPCAVLEEQLVTTPVEITTTEAVSLALYLRFLKRISAHSRNLISSLVNPFDRIGYSEKKPKKS